MNTLDGINNNSIDFNLKLNNQIYFSEVNVCFVYNIDIVNSLVSFNCSTLCATNRTKFFAVLLFSDRMIYP